MGMCYDVSMRLKFKNNDEVLRGLKKYVQTCKANLHTGEMRAEGVDTDTADGLIQVLLAGWRANRFHREENTDGSVLYGNTFSASYGWEAVMMGMFEAIGPCLQDRSSITINTDNDYDKAVVRNGEVVWIH